MSYTQLAVLAVALAAMLDLFIVRTRLLFRKALWTSYAIILPFQILTNWWLTSHNIVIYTKHQIMGPRLASAPLEDIAFGFALILSVLSLWVFWGRRGASH
ncbi:MAG TPA: lycopene cyclase domain-containing protein [Candidatus Nanopelagicaceae bacterium]